MWKEYENQEEHYLVLPQGLNKERVIDVLESYCKDHRYGRCDTYEQIAEWLGECSFISEFPLDEDGCPRHVDVLRYEVELSI
jgi:hypothetical protein